MLIEVMNEYRVAHFFTAHAVNIVVNYISTVYNTLQ